MLDIYLETEAQTIIKIADKNKSVLIIGDADSDYALNTIKYYDSTKKARGDYKGGKLIDAFDAAKEFQAEFVFLLNLKEKVDYIDLIDILKQYDFAYITPVNLYISDYFYDLNRGNKRVYYAQDYLERASVFNDSTLILTDKHASLYEDIDVYLDEMKNQCGPITGVVNTGSKGNNLIYVANNLKDYPYSNVVLASILTTTDLGEYPSIKELDVVFDMDDFDVGEFPIVYFKNNFQTKTTIENLINFEKFNPIFKSVFVDRILKYISRTYDLSKYTGKLYTPHQKILIEKEIETYFESLTNWIIRKFEIETVVFYKEDVGVGRVESTVSIWPKSTTEKYRLVVK
ncbi:hypothetical protein [Lysinibacillus fusiformis]|uniref:hypothetical protein n=1 Tax=Lysinibacillus fusiformis TaxID=28031 RepID=UPI002E1AF700|nr:hypothetical protein [Lysinibacillus fusiformis]